MTPSPIDRVLERARWAPSGDNEQPWRFERRGSDAVRVVVQDTRDRCVYDLDGKPTLLAAGALMENVVLSAGAIGFDVAATLEPSDREGRLIVEIRLKPDFARPPDPLHAFIESRQVQRGLLSPRRLTSREKDRVAEAIGPDFSIEWRETIAERLRVAWFLWRVARFRLNLPEAYPTHASIVAWGTEFSDDRMPDRSLTLEPLTRWAMRWALVRWERARALNRWMAGAWTAGWTMDFLPQLMTGAFAALRAKTPPTTTLDYIKAGRAVQRFWLALTREGLWHQPAYTPIQFGRYLREGRSFTDDLESLERARRLDEAFRRTLGPSTDDLVWMGRVGAGRGRRARSLRLPVDRLWAPPA